MQVLIDSRFMTFPRFLKRFCRIIKRKLWRSSEEFVRDNFSHCSDAEKKHLKWDLLYVYLFQGISFVQYWEQSFDKLDKQSRRCMLPKEELVRFDKKYNRKEDIHIVGNKWYAYKKFKDFYSRECCLVEIGKNKSATDDSLDAFSDFISRHNRFMVKPLYKDSGVGISIIEVLENYDVCDIMEKCPNSDFIAEELIMQSDDLARFHPSSVNTLRLNTIRCKDKTEVLWPILRFGRSGNVVDNAHYNGVFAVVDVNTGITIGAGDVKRHKYTEHPDSHVPLVGFQIPQWKEVCDMVKNLATMTDGLRFIGWDLAHTEKGWVLVEANTSPGILSPMVTGKGIKKEFYAIRKRM